MNKLTLYIASALFAVGLSACSTYLDKEYDISLAEDQVFSNEENTRGFLANIYTNLPDGFSGYTNGQFLGASRDCMTDNAISYWNVHYYHGVLTDSYDATNHPLLGFWSDNLSAIRKANQFLKNANESVIGNVEKSGDDNHLYDRNMAEAKLLRAIFHFELVRWFGAAPIIGEDEEGTPIVFDLSNPGAMNMERTDAADALKWIADQCDLVKDELPFRYEDETQNWGRMNGAAAYALKSRALLYRASPLNNPSNNSTYWTEAAQAAKDFITANNKQSNPYKLYNTGNPDNDYYECFVTTPTLNDEFILSRSTWTTNAIEVFLAPCGFSGSLNSVGRTNPTQNLVDCYETKNGLPIDEDPTYDDQNPYANRDPRLEQTILHHGSMWGDKEQEEYRAVDVSTPDGVDYQELHGGTLTGYYTKKFLNNISFKNPTTPIHAWPIFRYGEILLNAAEAVNEAEGPSAAYTYINELRERVGMPDYSGMSKEEFRERIRNERRIELCFEDHRFFDERRWKIFEGQSVSSETGKPMYQQYYNLYGVTVTNPSSPSYEYGPADAHPTRSFTSPKNYLFPLPDDEVKRAPNLGQNPGWELSASSEEEVSGTTE
ncbi:RagB/SusD family nutrient uptake outer membrane protein [Mangrovibacterium lignilyticum]|uniref:RagB/SusD family nutrient uptake outer membrane protein n=1 Tax=Mangrovibacterium lignilyticum TaxID=2668052 RepID=UPI0013D19030|nr:RagB/SusD family nutrient uptake outer membrane protein [Mangrovibacterium lignilyticum]